MKKIISIAIVALAAFSLKADYLLWQLAQTDSTSIGPYNYVKLWATDQTGNTWSTGYNVIAQQSVSSEQNTVTFNLGGSYNSSSYSTYFVEYATYDASSDSTTSVAGYTGSWSDLKNSVWTKMTDFATSVTAYAGGQYSSVPEPTSGLMLMLGLALMGLKRKRA